MTSKIYRAGRSLLAGTFGIAAASAAISCNSSRDETISSRQPAPVLSNKSTSQPLGAHWVQDQRLRLVMAELSKQNPNWPAGIPQEPESKRQGKPEDFDEVANLANSLMLAADRLPDVAGGIKMNEADRRGFLAEAQVLHDQAERLRDAARLHRIEQMQIQMTSINSTCISCHSRYRDFSGQLNSPQALLWWPQ